MKKQFDFRWAQKLGRRSFLMGAGASIALPFLESNASQNAPHSKLKNSEHKMRMVCIGLEYGLYPTHFFPESTGRSYVMPELLKPLTSLKEDFTVFSNLDHPGITGGHFATHTFLSGIKSNNAKAHPEGNITVDQKAAEFIGAQTRYPSMQISLGGGGISWTRNGVKIPPMTKLQTIFDALFVETPMSKKRRVTESFKLNGSILDLVKEDALALKQRSSRNDLEKLDEYFTSIREVEIRLQQSEAWLEKAKPKTNYELPRSSGSFYREVPVFYDLMKLALETDSTRVLSLGINGWRGNSGLPGVTKGYHDITHHGHSEDKLKQLSIIESFHTKQFSRFLEKLKISQASADSSLLEQTMVLFGSGLGNANSHSNRNLPIVLAGGGFKHGEHRDYANGQGNQTPACNLFVTMLQKFGMELNQFGTSNGSLAGMS